MNKDEPRRYALTILTFRSLMTVRPFGPWLTLPSGRQFWIAYAMRVLVAAASAHANQTIRPAPPRQGAPWHESNCDHPTQLELPIYV